MFTQMQRFWLFSAVPEETQRKSGEHKIKKKKIKIKGKLFAVYPVKVDKLEKLKRSRKFKSAILRSQFGSESAIDWMERVADRKDFRVPAVQNSVFPDLRLSN